MATTWWRGRAVKALIPLLAGISLFLAACTDEAGSEPEATPAPHPPVSGQVPMLGDCATCHLAEVDGEIVGTKPVRDIPHEIEGREQCTFCHSDRLAPTPTGHGDIADEFCLACHTTSSTPPEMAHVSRDVPCSTCHQTFLSLPEDHEGRSDSMCWLCHEGMEQVPPSALHPLSNHGSCTACHQEAMVGALPSSHAERGEKLCTLCHSEMAEGTPERPHTLENRSNCISCHLPASQ